MILKIINSLIGQPLGMRVKIKLDHLIPMMDYNSIVHGCHSKLDQGGRGIPLKCI